GRPLGRRQEGRGRLPGPGGGHHRRVREDEVLGPGDGGRGGEVRRPEGWGGEDGHRAGPVRQVRRPADPTAERRARRPQGDGGGVGPLRGHHHGKGRRGRGGDE